MAIAFEGYDYVQASGNMSGTITIPAATDYAVCAIQGYGYSSFTSVSIDGTAMSLIDENHGTSDCYIYGLVAPTTGVGVSTVSVSGAWSEGVTYMFAFFSDVDQTTPTRDSAAQDADSGVSSAVLSCAAGDHAFVSGFGNTPPTLTDNSQTLIVDNIFYRSQNGGCSRKAITSGTTTTVGTSGNNYGTMVAVILIEASASTGYTLDADPGAYSLIGTDADLAFNRVLEADPGVYALTGSDVDLVFNRALTADPGEYVLTGADADLIQGLLLTAEPGSYVVTGTDADLIFNKVLHADTGVYTLTGRSANLIYSGNLPTLQGRSPLGIKKKYYTKDKKRVYYILSELRGT